MPKANVELTGNIRLIDQHGRERRAQNTMTAGGLTLLRDFLAAPAASFAPTPPTWIVLGSGTAPVTPSLTTVPGETFRTPIIGRDVAGNSAIYHFFIADADNIGQSIGVYGLVGGSDATQAAGTGSLVAVANEPNPFGKDSITTFAGDWTITISGSTS